MVRELCSYSPALFRVGCKAEVLGSDGGQPSVGASTASTLTSCLESCRRKDFPPRTARWKLLDVMWILLDVLDVMETARRASLLAARQRTPVPTSLRGPPRTHTRPRLSASLNVIMVSSLFRPFVGGTPHYPLSRWLGILEFAMQRLIQIYHTPRPSMVAGCRAMRLLWIPSVLETHEQLCAAL